jgi:glycosyltransferase involved in cell wall biosynthesis
LLTDAYLKLCGKFFEPSVESKIKGEPGWEKVEYFGSLNMKKVMQVLNQSIAGLVTFHPLPNHINAQPNKMFEYMSAGIPVIASDFPLWSEIIVGNDCGLCVDPLNPQAIAEAIDFLCENPMEAERMGKNGLRVVKEKYNWSTEEKNLINLYNKVLDN